MGVGLVSEAQDVQRVRCDIYHFRRTPYPYPAYLTSCIVQHNTYS